MFTSISPRARASEARTTRQRERRPFAVARAGATSIGGQDFLPAVAPKSPLSGRAMGVLQIARRWNSAADLPDVSKCFRGIAQSIHASDHHATLHGVVFDILVGSTSRVGLAAVFPVDDRRMACRAVAREPRARLRPLGFGAAAFVASRAKAGGPGRTRTCNQTVMSGRILIDFVDFPAFSSWVERVRCDLIRPFLVRNWCGGKRRKPS